jgi:hypothetical protein
MMFRVDLEGLASYRNRWEWVARAYPARATRACKERCIVVIVINPSPRKFSCGPARKSRRAIGANGGGAR